MKLLQILQLLIDIAPKVVQLFSKKRTPEKYCKECKQTYSGLHDCPVDNLPFE